MRISADRCGDGCERTELASCRGRHGPPWPRAGAVCGSALQEDTGYSLQSPSLSSSLRQQGQTLACCLLLTTGHSISLNCILATKRDDQFPQSLRRDRSDSLGSSVLGIQYDILHPPPRCLLVEANTLSRRWKVESDTTSFSPGG